jgi:hypothetical protein
MVLPREKLRQYNWVQFYDCRTNVKDRKSGALIGRYLAVSGYMDRWHIYQIMGGSLVINNWVTSFDDAVKIAQLIDKVYGDYLGVWEIWPSADMIGIARLSVKGGEAVYNAITEVDKLNRNISYADFERILKENIK